MTPSGVPKAKSPSRRQGRPGLSHTVALSGVVLVLGGCALMPEPLTPEEKWAVIEQDKRMIFGDNAPVTGPISLEEAMARAVKFNLDHRSEMLSQAVAQRQLDLSSYDMLPKLASSAGLSNRSNDAASSSESIRTHTQSLEPSISTERRMWSAQTAVTWNILDFGVSYIRARQAADRSLMADEQRRKVLHNIIQDVRTTYWRSVAAERLLRRIDPLLKRTEEALGDAQAIEQQSIRAPLEDLQYQRGLLATLERLRALRRELVGAKIQLAALMNLKPGTDFHVVVPDEKRDVPLPRVTTPADDLVNVALHNRPELIQASYDNRVSSAETRRILLEMLPGINVNAGSSYDSNRYLTNNQWSTYGVGVAWNLLTLFSTPARLELAEADQTLKKVKHAALSMAVMAQVNVANLRLQQATEEYVTARQQANVEQRIFQQLVNAGQVQRSGDLSVIQADAENVFAALRRDTAYANVQNAYGALMVSVGADPLPDVVADNTLPTLSGQIAKTLRDWDTGAALSRAVEATQKAAEAVKAAEKAAENSAMPATPQPAPASAEAPVPVAATTAAEPLKRVGKS